MKHTLNQDMDQVNVLVVSNDPVLTAGFGTQACNPVREVMMITSTDLSKLQLVDEHSKLVILDLDTVNGENQKKIKELRSHADCPIICVATSSDAQLIADVLDAGANDFVRKPVNMIELLARMRAAIRNYTKQPKLLQKFQSGPLSVDLMARQVRLKGAVIHLTPIEYKLLTCLIESRGKVVSHERLLSEVWGEAYVQDSQYLRVYVGYLRKKIEEDPENPKLLLTEHRVGYRLSV